jgi:pilus assembly protein FimV
MAFDKRKALQGALTLTQQGKWDKAITEYQAILRADPKDTTVCNTLGDLYARVGRAGEAIEQYLKVGSLYRADGLSVKAIAVYKKIIKLDPHRLEAHLACADLYEEQGLSGEAKVQLATVAEQYARTGNASKVVEIYQRLAQLDPGNAAVLGKLADHMTRAGMRDQAAAEYQRAAEAARAAGREPEARRFLQRLFELKPDSPAAAMATAEQALRDGQFPQAVEALGKVTRTESGNAQAWRLLGEAQSRLLRPAEAVAALEQAVRLGVSELDVWQPLAVNLARAGRAEEGMALCARAAQDALTREEPDEALAITRAFLAEVPDLTAAHTHLIELLRQQGREEEAREALWALAAVHEARGEAEAAREVFRDLVERYPADEEARSRLTAMESGPPEAPLAAAAPAVLEEEPAPPPAEPSAVLPPADETSPPLQEGLPDVEAALPESPGEPLLLDAVPPDAPQEAATFDLSLDEEPPATAEGASLLETVDELRPALHPSPLFPLDESGEMPGMPLPVEQPGETFGSGLLDGEEPPVSFLDEDTSGEDVPGEAAELLAEAGVYLKYGLSEKARERLVEVVRLLPDYLPARRKLKALYVERSQLAEASSETLAIARLLLEHGQREAAVAELEEGLTLEPDEPELSGLLRKLRGTAPARPASRPPVPPPPAAAPPPPVEPAPPEAEPAFELLGAAEADTPEPAAAELPLAPDGGVETVVEPPAPETAATFELAPDEDHLAATPPAPAAAPAQASQEEEEELPADLRALLEESEEEPSILVAGEREDLDQGMADDVAEAEFYLSQGMTEEARSVLRRMQARAPQHPAVEDLRQRLAAARLAEAPASGPPPLQPAVEPEAVEIPLEPAVADAEPERPPAAQAPLLDQALERFPGLEDLAAEASLLESPAAQPNTEPAAVTGEAEPGQPAGIRLGPGGPAEPVVPKFMVQDDRAPDDTAAFVDLGKELEAEMAAEEQAAAASQGGALVNELLKEFQKGVRDHLDEKDFETHYNLGIAYKEMDLYDEAIQEFRLAARDPGRALPCANLVGLCYLSKGEAVQAIRELTAGLEIAGHPGEAYHGLRYDLGLAFEASGELASALECYETLQKQNARFRDVRARAATLRDRLRAKAAEAAAAAAAAAVTEPEAPAPPPAPPEPTRRATPKKKISFV